MSKSNTKRKNPLLSKLTAQQSITTAYPHSAPISLQDGSFSGFTSQKNWSKELIAAATTLQSIAMSSTRVRILLSYAVKTSIPIILTILRLFLVLNQTFVISLLLIFVYIVVLQK